MSKKPEKAIRIRIDMLDWKTVVHVEKLKKFYNGFSFSNFLYVLELL